MDARGGDDGQGGDDGVGDPGDPKRITVSFEYLGIIDEDSISLNAI